MSEQRWAAHSHLSKGFKRQMGSLIARGLTPDERKRYESVAVAERQEAKRAERREVPTKRQEREMQEAVEIIAANPLLVLAAMLGGPLGPMGPQR
jgi:hypothetical protein